LRQPSTADGGNFLVNASRSILYASRGADWQAAARSEALSAARRHQLGAQDGCNRRPLTRVTSVALTD